MKNHTSIASLAILLVLLLSGLTTEAQKKYYVATWGKSTNDGTTTKPWDLKTALSKTTVVKGGDTIFIESGTYEGHFNCLLQGSVGKPIVILPLKRELDASPVIMDGKSGAEGIDPWNDPNFSFEQSSSYVTVRDIHFTSSFTSRILDNPEGHDPAYTPGVSLSGTYCKLINCFIYDNLSNGVIAGYRSTAAEMYGCIIFYNGAVTAGDPRSHGAYIQNNHSEIKNLENNIVFNNYRTGLHVYTGGGLMSNVHVIGNIVFNNGIMRASGFTDKNIIVGAPGGGYSKMLVQRNYTYNSPGLQGTGIQMGYSGNSEDCIVKDNLIFNSLHPFYVRGWFDVTLTNNKVATHEQSVINEVILPHTENNITYGRYKIDNNQYYTSVAASNYFMYKYFNLDQVTGNFAQWQKDTGFDKNSSMTLSLPSTNWVSIEPNKYENGRAHIVVFNFESKNAQTVNVSSFLTPGSEYVVYDAQNLFTPLLQGTLTGSTIDIPLNNDKVRPPYGTVVNNNIKHTPKEFNAFLIRSRSVPKTIKAISLNPATTRTTSVFTYDSPTAQKVTITVTDQANNVVIPPLQVDAKAGINTATITVSALAPGNYFVVVNDAQGSDRIEITRDTDPLPDPPVTIASCTPNPVIQTLTITYTAPKAQAILFDLYNSSGSKLQSTSTEATIGTNTANIDLGAFPDGAYYMVVSNAASSAYCNFTKKSEPDIVFEMVDCSPDQADDILFIKFNQPASAQVNYTIVNAKSTTVLSGNVVAQKGENIIQINVSTLEEGSHQANLVYLGQTISCSFVKNPNVPPPIEIVSCAYIEETENSILTFISQIDQTFTIQYYNASGTKVLSPISINAKKGTNQHTASLLGLPEGDYYAVIDDYNRNTYCKVTKLPAPPPPTPISITKCPSEAIDQLVAISVNSPNTETIQIKLYDNQGKILSSTSKEATSGVNQIQVDVSVFVEGVYYIEISNSYSGDFCEFVIARTAALPLEIRSCEPSPAIDFIFVNLYAPNTETLDFAAINTSQQKFLVQSLAANEGLNAYKIDISTLPKGKYTITVNNSNEETTCEFTKENPEPVAIQNCAYNENDFTIGVAYNSPKAQNLTIGLYNSLGNSMIPPIQMAASSGTNQFSLQTSGFPTGTYYPVIYDGYTSVYCETIVLPTPPPQNQIALTGCSPVPVVEILQTEFTSALSETITYQIGTSFGQKLLEGQIVANAGTNAFEVNLSNLSDGEYYFAIFNGSSHDFCSFSVAKVTIPPLEIKSCAPTASFDWILTEFFNPIQEEITINIFNSSNTVVLTKSVPAEAGLNEIKTDISALPIGEYRLELRNGTESDNCLFDKINKPDYSISIVSCPNEKPLENVEITFYSPSNQTITLRFYNNSGTEVTSPVQYAAKYGNNKIGPISIAQFEAGEYYMVLTANNVIYCKFEKSDPEPDQTIDVVSCDPSTTTGAVQISFTLYKNSDVTLKVYNQIGAWIRDVQYKALLAGQNTINTDLSDLPDNHYYLVLSDHKSHDFCDAFLQTESVAQLEMIDCTPKQVTDYVVAEFLSPALQTVQFQIVNESEQTIYSQDFHAKEGYNQVTLSVENWAIGNYRIEITDANSQVGCTFFKQEATQEKPLEVMYCLLENENTLQTAIYSSIEQDVDISVYSNDGSPVLPRISIRLQKGTNIRTTNVSSLKQGKYYYVVSNPSTITYCEFGKNVTAGGPVLEVTLCSPTPTLGETFVNFYLSEDGMVNLKVINTREQVLIESEIQAIAGRNQVLVDLSEFPIGTYFAVLNYKTAQTYCELEHVDFIEPESRISILNCSPKTASNILYVEFDSPFAEQVIVRIKNAAEEILPQIFYFNATIGTQKIVIPLPNSMKRGNYQLILSNNSSSDVCDFFKEKNNGKPQLTITNVYPNPSSGWVYCEYYSYTDEDVWFEIYDNGSRLISKTKQSTVAGLNNFSIDLSAETPGLYIIVIRQAKDKHSFKQLITD